MVLNIIGIGLGDETDITLKGLALVKKSDFIYLESYTSRLNCDIAKLEELYGKKIILANRDMVENGTEIISNSKEKEVSFLVIGDVFGATTHVDIMERAKEEKIKVNIVHNASILTSVGETGLELYKFGKTTSIPFENSNVVSPVKVFDENKKLGMHTLFLLDLRPDEERFMTINDAIGYLTKNKVKSDLLAVACCAMGSSRQVIKSGELSELVKLKFDVYPQCLIIPGNLHFKEEEVLETFKV
jgi:diphthine synthase